MDFLNSILRDWKGSGQIEDRLESPKWRRQFLDAWQFFGVEDPPGPNTMASLIQLRCLLQRMVETLDAREPQSPGDISELNRFLALRQPIPCLVAEEQHYRLQMQPTQRDWYWVMTEIALSFARILLDDYTRVKMCANPDCRWVFYDESRNRTRRWCERRYCGNLMKVRRFRARQAVPSVKT